MTDILSSTHRRRILDRQHPHISLTPEQAAAVEPGRIIIEPWRVWLEVHGAKRDKKAGWHLDYTIRDDRPRLMRRNPHAGDIRASVDIFGVPRRVSEQDAAAAAEASHYTQSIARAVAREGEEVVPVAYQNLLTKMAHRKWGDYERNERSTEVAEKQFKQLERRIRTMGGEAARLGIDLTPQLVGMVREAEAILAAERRRLKNAA